MPRLGDEAAWSSVARPSPLRPVAGREERQYSRRRDVRRLFRSSCDGGPPALPSTQIRPNHNGGICRVAVCECARYLLVAL